MHTIETTLLKLMSEPNALTYDLNALKAQYNYEAILESNEGSELFSEVTMIAMSLCGTSGQDLAFGFMSNENGTIVEEFLHNVSFNGSRSTPLILRAINIRLANLVELEDPTV